MVSRKSVRRDLGSLAGIVILAGCVTTVRAATVFLDMDVQLDQVAPEDAKMYRVGGHDLDRIAYDDRSLDPVTHKVKITYLAHFILGRWMPTTPTDASVLDLGSKPYKLDLVTAADHGRPLVVVFEGASRRMAILARPDFHMLIAGNYTIDATPITGYGALAPPKNADDPSTMPLKSGMPPMPHPPVEGVTKGHFSSASSYGQLLDDPRSRAVLVKYIPEVVANPQSQLARALPLKALAQFEPSMSEVKLEQIDQGLAPLAIKPQP
jgi:hypothetical protein